MVTIQDYYSLILIVRCMKLKLKMFMKILVKTKKCLILVIAQLSQSIDDLNKLVLGKIKNKIGSIALEECVVLKIYLLLVDDSSKDKKAKHVNKHVVARISRSESNDVLLNN